MARYAIGDVQGCHQSLLELLTKINFAPGKDRLWIAGDLVNRGPKSLESLRYIKALTELDHKPAKVVLGNHDLHLLALYYTQKPPKRKDTFDEILAAPDCDELMTWLRHQPLMVWSKKHDVVMSHAGIPHIWSIKEAHSLSQEVATTLSGPDYVDFFKRMYGNQPNNWASSLKGMDRLRVITNYFTRMRFIKSTGELDFAAKEAIGSAPENYLPWFTLKRKEVTRVVFGHWAALEGKTGSEQFQALDTGCVWGGTLTAMNLKNLKRTACKSELEC